MTRTRLDLSDALTASAAAECRAFKAADERALAGHRAMIDKGKVLNVATLAGLTQTSEQANLEVEREGRGLTHHFLHSPRISLRGETPLEALREGQLDLVARTVMTEMEL